MVTDIILFFISALVLLFILRTLKSIRTLRTCIRDFPGPPGQFIIGNLKDLYMEPDQWWLNIVQYSKKYFPIYRVWIGLVVTIHMLCPQDIEIIMASREHNRKGPIYNFLHDWLGTGLLTSAGTKWHSRRKMLTPAFHFNVLQQFFTIFLEQSAKLVEQLQDECNKNSTDVVPIISQYTLHSICETAMGTNLDTNNENHNRYKDAVHRMGYLIVYRMVRPWLFFDWIYMCTKTWREQKTLCNILHSFSRSVIENRRKNYANQDTQKASSNKKKRLAMLDMLLSAEASGASIDNEGILEEVDTFMFEGHDTTASSLGFTLMLLACNKDVQERVVEELDAVFGNADTPITYQGLQELSYMDRCIKESLRIYPSVPDISRITDKEIRTYTGYTIPPETIVHVHIYDLHHNPDIYPDPEKFDPDRFLPENSHSRHPFAYIPFSAGPRNCIGQKFAFLEMKTAISAILRKYELEPVDTPSSLTLYVDLVLRTKNGIRVKFRQRRV